MMNKPMYEVCELCLQAIVNDDYTPIDYHYSGSEADEKYLAIRHGIHTLESTGYLVTGDEDLGFKTTPCECCGDELHGNRHSVTVMEST